MHARSTPSAPPLLATSNDPWLAVVGGKPAIAYSALPGAWYMRAVDGDGDAWNQGVPIDPQTNFADAQLLELGSDVDVAGGGTPPGFEVYLSTCGLTFDGFITGDPRHWSLVSAPR